MNDRLYLVAILFASFFGMANAHAPGNSRRRRSPFGNKGFKLRTMSLFFLLAFFALEPSVHAQCPQPAGGFKLGRGIKVNGNIPNAGTWTYLRTHQDPVARYPRIAPDDVCDGVGGIRLNHYGFVPGDWIAIRSTATWDWIEGQPEVGAPGSHLAGVFASDAPSGFDQKSVIERVPWPTNAGVDYASSVTFHDHLPTDIPEDFLIPYSANTAWLPQESVLLQVPAGGNYLYVSPTDWYFGNTAPDGKFEVLEVDCSTLSVYVPPISHPVGVPFVTLEYPIMNSGLPGYLEGMATGVPPGVSVQVENGHVVISGTPTQAGEFSVTVNIENGCKTFSRTFGMDICSLSVPAVPINGEINIPLTQSFPIHSVAGSPSVSVNGLPAGLTGSQQGNFYVISGTPTECGVFTATVSDNTCHPFTTPFSVTICCPELDVVLRGNGAPISDGSITPIQNNGTKFPDTLVGEAAGGVYLLRNNGCKALDVSDIYLSSTPHFRFSANPPPTGSIAPGNFSQLGLIFEPTTTGTHIATVTIRSNDPNEDPYTFRIQGKGIAPSAIVLAGGDIVPPGDTTPSALDGTSFSSITVGTSDTHQFFLKNAGLATLEATSLQSSHGNFTVNPITLTVLSDDMVSFSVTYSPTTVGTHVSTISIFSNDPNNNPYEFQVEGSATAVPAPEITVTGKNIVISDGDNSPSTVDGTVFSDIPLGSTGALAFRVRNDGTANLDLSSLSTDSSLFSWSRSSATIAPGIPQYFSLFYQPTAPGTDTATVTIRSNDSDEDPYTFLVQGTAFDPLPSYPLVMQTPVGHWGYWTMRGRDRVSAKTGSFVLHPDAAIAAVGDFIGSADWDIVVRDGLTVNVVELDGQGNLVASHLVTQSLSLDWVLRGAGDFNGDGDLDLVCQNIDGRLAVWYLNGATTIGAAYFNSDLQSSVLWDIRGIADFNGDGFDDFVIEHRDGRVGLWYMQNLNRIGAASLNYDVQSSVHWNIVATADTNGDGNPDIIWQHPDGRLYTYEIVNGVVTDRLTLLEDLSNSRLWSIRNSGFQPMTPRFDRDDDGLNDLLYQDNDGRLVTWFMDSDLRLGAESHDKDVQFDPGWRVAGQTDVDGDGEEDFVWQHDDGSLYIWLMYGNLYLAGAPVSHDVRHAAHWRIVGIEDINRDGLDDWVFQNTAQGGVIVWYMDGNQRIGTDTISGSNSTAWRLAAVVDMNSDSHADFVWQHTATGNLAVWYMDNEVASQTDLFSDAVSSSWKLESVHDLDHDGHPDLVFEHQDGRQYAWYLDGITRTGTAPLRSVYSTWEIRHSGD